MAAPADHERELARLGINHFLTKPYRAEELLAHIDMELVPSGNSTAILPQSLRSV